MRIPTSLSNHDASITKQWTSREDLHVEKGPPYSFCVKYMTSRRRRQEERHREEEERLRREAERRREEEPGFDALRL